MKVTLTIASQGARMRVFLDANILLAQSASTGDWKPLDKALQAEMAALLGATHTTPGQVQAASR